MILELSGKKVHIKDFTLTEKEFVNRYATIKPWRVMGEKQREKALKLAYKDYSKHKTKPAKDSVNK